MSKPELDLPCSQGKPSQPSYPTWRAYAYPRPNRLVIRNDVKIFRHRETQPDRNQRQTQPNADPTDHGTAIRRRKHQPADSYQQREQRYRRCRDGVQALAQRLDRYAATYAIKCGGMAPKTERTHPPIETLQRGIVGRRCDEGDQNRRRSRNQSHDAETNPLTFRVGTR